MDFSELCQSFCLDMVANLKISALSTPWNTAVLMIRIITLQQDLCVFSEKWEVRDWPVRTALAEGSARSKADLPSVFRMFGSAPCWSNTRRKQNLLPLSHTQICNILLNQISITLIPLVNKFLAVWFSYQCKRLFCPWWQPREAEYSSSCPWRWGPHRDTTGGWPLRRGQKNKHCAEEWARHHPWHEHWPLSAGGVPPRLSCQSLKEVYKCKTAVFNPMRILTHLKSTLLISYFILEICLINYLCYILR